ncbi:MAG: hypothetical protein U1E65_15615 [Myxococcota bacterium]
MAKPKKLNQIVAVEKDIKTRVFARLSEIYKLFQKPSAFSGFAKTYRKKDEESEDFPPEKQVVQANAEELLKEIVREMSELFDITATKDWANTSARADIVVDGKTLVEAAPSTFILFLEKQLRDLKAEIEKIPVLDAAEEWSFDASSQLYKAPPSSTHKTKKEPRVITKFQPTEHHPGQADVVFEDRVVGYWDTVKMSAAIPTLRRRQLLERLEAVSNAVKAAREQANEAEAQEKEVARKVFSYILG